MRGSSTRRCGFVIALVLAGLVGVCFQACVLIRRAPFVPPLVVLDHDINDGGAELRAGAFVGGTWVASQDGLALGPGGSGEVRLPVAAPEQGAPLLLKVWFYAGGALHNLIECSSDGQTFVELVRDRRLNGDQVPLDRCLGRSTLWLRFSARNDGSALRLSLDKIQLVRSYPMVVSWAGIHLAAGLVVFLALVLWLVAARPSGWVAAVLIGLLTLGVCVVVPAGGLSRQLRILGLSLDGAWLASGTTLAVAWLAILPHPHRMVDRVDLARLTLLWIVGVGACARLAHVAASAGQPMEPDAITVMALAEQMHGPYDTSFREPMWLWAFRFFRLLVVHPEMALRLFSLTCSLALVVGGAWLARRTFQSNVMGLAAAWFLAIHPYLVESAARGLRTELNALCLALIAGFTLTPGPRSRGGLLVLGTSLGVGTLTQLNSLAASLPMLLLGIARGRVPWRAAAVCVAATTVAVTPHLVSSYKSFGDPLWSLNVHGIFYRNYEFVSVRKTGCPGCPTPEMLASDAYAGEPVTMAGYVFGMHAPSEVAQRILRGYLMVYIFSTPLLEALLGTGRRIAWLLYMAGVALLLRGPGRDLLLLPVASLNLLAFIVPIGLEYRLVMPAVTFVAIATSRPVVLAAQHLVSPLERLFAKRSDEPGTAPV